jgi:hypothetical protein
MYNVLTNDMPTVTTNKQKKPRNIVGFEPCGPVAEMLNNEFRSGASKTHVLEDCIVKAVGSKYPKLAERFRILREEAAWAMAEKTTV